MELLERFDDEEVDREPDRPTPVRVASEGAASIRYSGQCAAKRFMIDLLDGGLGQEVSRDSLLERL